MIEQLYTKHREGLLKRAWKIVKDDQVAEDIVQNAFIETFKRGTDYFNNSETGIISFLNTCVDSKGYNHLRHLKVRRRNASGLMIVGNVEIKEVWHDVLNKRLQELIPKLAPRQKVVFELIYFHEMTAPEAAVVLGINENTVRVTYKNAVDYLVKHFNEHAYHAKYENKLCT